MERMWVSLVARTIGLLLPSVLLALSPAVTHAADQPRVVKAAKIVFEANDSEYATPQAACTAWINRTQAGSTFVGLDEYTPGDTHVRCLWKRRDGDQDGQVAVYASARCPTNSRPTNDALATRECECDSGFEPRGAVCASADTSHAAEEDAALAAGGDTPRKTPPNPSDDWMRDREVKCKAAQDAESKAAGKQFEDRGGKPQILPPDVQEHHIMTNKDKKYKPTFEEIAAGAGVTLDDDINLISLAGHGGKHGPDYHEPVLNRLRAALKGKTPHTQAYKDTFMEAMKELRRDLARQGSHLNRLVCK